MSDIRLFKEMLKDYKAGRYTRKPVGALLSVVIAIVYFMMPVDMVADIVLFPGLIDDAAVWALAIKKVRSELQKYRLWKESAPRDI